MTSQHRYTRAKAIPSEDDPVVMPVVRRFIEVVEALGKGHILRAKDIVEYMRDLGPDVSFQMDSQSGGVQLSLGAPAQPVLRPWSKYFAYGVEQANLRAGPDSDARALEAYQRALLFAPDSLSDDIRAKIAVYAGAMMKRLSRLDEAETWLVRAEPLWQNSQWRDDAVYNLAGVYAMHGKRASMMRLLHGLPKSSPILVRVQRALTTYFRDYADDEELLKLLPRTPKRRKRWRLGGDHQLEP